MLGGERPDPPRDQGRLHRRTARRIDDNGDRLGAFALERTFQDAGESGQRQPPLERPEPADDAGELDHRHHRRRIAEALEG